MAEDGKMESQSVQDISRKTDVISYAMLAEVTHFQHERVADFKYMMQCYITEQIKFYNKVRSSFLMHQSQTLLHVKLQVTHSNSFLFFVFTTSVSDYRQIACDTGNVQ